ncbi:hypothetical protein FGG08_007456 [Glutinoglossum americanum]|uniref:Uncharacterized protein n=1 Tax=Glutinoglossum americanum TaxID=1670608 RepID=A0A9P8HW90_9PEZI|nr:hypothetical protein FGG08_007456 [Glutinoglossum americanum]
MCCLTSMIVGIPDTTVHLTTVNRFWASVQLISVRWRPNDLSTFPNAARPTPNTAVPSEINAFASLDLGKPTSPTEITVSTTRTSPEATGSNRNTMSSSPGPIAGNTPLTLGVKVGIGIGTAITFLLLVGTVTFILRKRRRRQGEVNVEYIDTSYGKAELEAGSRPLGNLESTIEEANPMEPHARGHTGARTELPAVTGRRISSGPVAHELESGNPPGVQELETDRHPHELGAMHSGVGSPNELRGDCHFPQELVETLPALAAHEGIQSLPLVDSMSGIGITQDNQAQIPAPKTPATNDHGVSSDGHDGDDELRWLENEERRIRERKERILARRKP